MKIKKFDVGSDVNTIECDIYNAVLEILQSQDSKLTVEFPHAKHLHIAFSEGEIIIKQGRRFFEKLRNPDRITLSIPSHLIPSLSLTGNRVEALIDGGIYERVAFYAHSGSLAVKDAALSELEAGGGEINATVSDVTVKGNLTVKTESGDAVIERVFASRTECRLKDGNVGAVDLNCRQTAMESESGNVTVSLHGGKADYSLSLLAKEGICNRENTATDSAANSFKAYSAKGNIYVDFLGEEKEN